MIIDLQEAMSCLFQFSDIEAKVFIYTGFTIKYYITLMIFDVGFSLMMGIVFVTSTHQKNYSRLSNRA